MVKKSPRSRKPVATPPPDPHAVFLSELARRCGERFNAEPAVEIGDAPRFSTFRLALGLRARPEATYRPTLVLRGSTADGYGYCVDVTGPDVPDLPTSQWRLTAVDLPPFPTLRVWPFRDWMASQNLGDTPAKHLTGVVDLITRAWLPLYLDRYRAAWESRTAFVDEEERRATRALYLLGVGDGEPPIACGFCGRPTAAFQVLISDRGALVRLRREICAPCLEQGAPALAVRL